MIDLNKQKIQLSEMPFGQTQNLECCLDGNLYLLDLSKNACSASLNFYRRLDSNRGKYSKYDAAAQRCDATISPDVTLYDAFSDISKPPAAKALY